MNSPHSQPSSNQGASRAAPNPNEGALGPYLRAIRARLGVVILITAAAALVSLVLVGQRSREYESTARLLVAPLPQSDDTYRGVQLIRDSGAPVRTVQTAATIIDSAAAAQRAATEIGGGYDAERIDKVVTVEPIGESNLVGVTAKAPNPRLAALLANTFASQSLAARQVQLRAQARSVRDTLGRSDPRRSELRRVALRGDPTLSLSQLAQVPTEPIGAPNWLVVALALIAGFTLASVAALLIERLDRRVRDSAELLQIAAHPVLARIPLHQRAEREGPFDAPPAVREAFRTLQIQLDQRAGGAARTVILTSPSSGDGKTTTALNLAFALVTAGHQVIVIDFDLRHPDIEAQLVMSASPGLVALLTSEGRLEELLRPVPSLPSLRIVPGASRPDDTSLLQVIPRRLGRILEQATELADYVVIDTAPLGEVGDALMIASFADELLLVGRAGNTERAAAEQTNELLERSGLTPAGWILVGEESGGRGYYYGSEPPRLVRSRG